MAVSEFWFFWLFPVAFALHNIEEAIWMPSFSKTAGRFARPVNSFEFIFAVIILTILSAIITELFFLNGKESFFCNLYFAFNLAMLLNVFFPHISATIALKKYCPGLLTGLTFLAPVTIYVLYYGYTNGFIKFPGFLFIAIIFSLLLIASIPFLFNTGKLLKKQLLMKKQPNVS